MRHSILTVLLSFVAGCICCSGSAWASSLFYVTPSTGSTYGGNPFPSANFSVGDVYTTGHLEVNTQLSDSSGSVNFDMTTRSTTTWSVIGGFDIWVLGEAGTPFTIYWDCTATATADVTGQLGGYSVGSVTPGGNCALNPGVSVNDYWDPTYMSVTTTNGGMLSGTTSTRTLIDPNNPDLTYSVATSFGQWLEIGGQNISGTHYPFTGFASFNEVYRFSSAPLEAAPTPEPNSAVLSTLFCGALLSLRMWRRGR